MSLRMVLLVAASATYLIAGWDKLAVALLAVLIVCPITGYRLGSRMWEIQEQRYAETVGDSYSVTTEPTPPSHD